VPKLELFGSSACPYTREVREWLEWRGLEFTEYDVEADRSARERLISLSAGQRSVPMLVEDGKVTQIGWQGRACVLNRD
jgi:mycoredoxin